MQKSLWVSNTKCFLFTKIGNNLLVIHFVNNLLLRGVLEMFGGQGGEVSLCRILNLRE